MRQIFRVTVPAQIAAHDFRGFLGLVFNFRIAAIPLYELEVLCRHHKPSCLIDNSGSQQELLQLSLPLVDDGLGTLGNKQRVPTMKGIENLYIQSNDGFVIVAVGFDCTGGGTPCSGSGQSLRLDQ